MFIRGGPRSGPLLSLAVWTQRVGNAGDLPGFFGRVVPGKMALQGPASSSWQYSLVNCRGRGRRTAAAGGDQSNQKDILDIQTVPENASGE